MALNKFWSSVISKVWNDKFYVENEVEQAELFERTGWMAEIRPMLFDDPDKYPISYKWAENPRYFATYHKGREEEYGYLRSVAIDFLEGLSEEDFNERITHYQGAIRFNMFDGFAETLAKSVLMGQYPVSVIEYPHIRQFGDENNLGQLPKLANVEASNYWRKTLQENKYEVVENWNWVVIK